MQRLKDISVKGKLVIILTMTSASALLFIAAAFTVYDQASSRRDATDRLTTLGRIVAGNLTAAVAFNDTRAAVEVLNTLRDEPDIQASCTYDQSRRLLAQYHRRAARACPDLGTGPQGAVITSSGATYTQIILLHDAPTGYIYLESNLAQMRARRTRFISIALYFLFASLGTAAILGSFLQRWITGPVVELANIVQGVSESSNYSLRAEPRGADEIGKLVSGFNYMLAEIESNQARLTQQSLYDELTKLPNRRLFSDRLALALEGAKRKQSIVALFYLDLDGFKLVNDTFGHSTGDVLLCQVADRLRRRVRTSDTLARIGGDEFTVVVGDLRNTEDAINLANDLLAEFATPFSISEHELSLTVSLGISFYPQDALQAEQLTRQADTAMYVAKSTGKNKVVLFTSEFGDAVKERLELENQLRGAIARGEMAVHYQPEFEANTNRLVCFEALARWGHPTFGMIPPAKFIPIAEETGLIVPIGLWIMEQACIEAVKWQALSESPVQVAVNISTVQLMRNDFVSRVKEILDRTGLKPTLLQCELTESVLLPGVCDPEGCLSQLHSLGVGLAIDDFGTGYSSLSYLQSAAINFVKIDRTFLARLTHSGDSNSTIQSIITLAHALRMTVIIEGVETLNQLSVAQELGCDQVQGYLLGRPSSNTGQFMRKENRPRPAESLVETPAQFCV